MRCAEDAWSHLVRGATSSVRSIEIVRHCSSNRCCGESVEILKRGVSSPLALGLSCAENPNGHYRILEEYRGEARRKSFSKGVSSQGGREQARTDASYRRPWKMTSASLLVDQPS